MNERMEMNMRLEAKVHVNDGIELPACTNPIRATLREAFVKEEVQKYEAVHGAGSWKFTERRSMSLIPWTTNQRSNIKKSLVNGLGKLQQDFNLSDADIESWLDSVEGLYEITADYTVHSYAKKRGPNKSWECKSEAEAEDAVAQHIIWTASNRRRGQGDVTEDLSGVKEL